MTKLGLVFCWGSNDEGQLGICDASGHNLATETLEESGINMSSMIGTSRLSLKRENTFRMNKDDVEDVSYFSRPMHIESLWKFKVKRGKHPGEV